MIYSSAITPDIVDSTTNGHNNNSHHHHHHHMLRQRSDDGFSSPRQEEDSLELSRENQLMGMGRQSPEGKDNMIVLPREQNMSKSVDQYSADSNNNNGKINVQVTVLFGEWEKEILWLLQRNLQMKFF